MPAPILPLIEAVTHWPERGALVGLDLGTKTIGVAVSDPDRQAGDRRRDASSARPSRPMRRGCWPLPASATPSASCSDCPSTWTAARDRARNRPAPLRATFPTSPISPIALWDERLSTAAVERELIGMDVSRARRAEVIDEHAAIFILQGALDRLAKLRGDR